MKYRRFTAVLLLLVCSLTCLPVRAAERVDGTAFAAKLAKLQTVFQHGKYWNNYNENGYESSGPVPCPACYSAGRYSCGSCSDECGAFYYGGKKIAGQCLGFAYQLGSAVFGGNPMNWEKHSDAARLQPGDILYGDLGPLFDRTSVKHAVFITDVGGDTVTFADCNWTGPCQIRWGESVSKAAVTAALANATVYHAPNNDVGALPKISLTTQGKVFTAGTNVTVDWFAPAGTVELMLLKKEQSGTYTEVITLSPTVSPFAVGKLPAGEYQIVLTHVGEKLTAQWHFLVYQPKTLPFTDVTKKDWFYKNGSVSFVYSQGLFKGMSDTRFAPEGTMQRSMFVTVLGRLAGAKVNHKQDTAFADVPTGKWYSGYVAWAAENGIVNGMSATEFAPDTPITREQICKMMVTYCDFAGLSLPDGDAVTFADAGEISKWARSYVAACSAAGLVSGIPLDGKLYFEPTATATRAQVATIIYNFVNNI